MTFRVEPAKPDHAVAMVPLLTDLALSEIAALGLSDPADAMLRLLGGSTYTFCGVDDESPLFIGGAAPTPDENGVAVVWLLMTRRVVRHQLPCLRAMRQQADIMSARWPLLRNYTDDSHARTRAWLEWLGFSVGEPILHPRTGNLVRPFERRLEHV